MANLYAYPPRGYHRYFGVYLVDTQAFIDFAFEHVPYNYPANPDSHISAHCASAFNQWVRRTYGRGYLPRIQLYAVVDDPNALLGDCIRLCFIVRECTTRKKDFQFEEHERDKVLLSRLRAIKDNAFDVEGNVKFVTIENPWSGMKG
ncbi:hypothetical protein FISHEDRAFT_78104 [Fistulina hepatica ATCC 64428]|nr:hypothetical protein FISHEDRAFT_78104 [Fistulina hepatica ATCC 64428]